MKSNRRHVIDFVTLNHDDDLLQELKQERLDKITAQKLGSTEVGAGSPRPVIGSAWTTSGAFEPNSRNAALTR
jgi:hypothetical protein